MVSSVAIQQPAQSQIVLVAFNFKTKEKAEQFIAKAEPLGLYAYRLPSGDQVWKFPDTSRDEYQCCFTTPVPAEPKDLAAWAAKVQLLFERECDNHSTRALTFEQSPAAAPRGRSH